MVKKEEKYMTYFKMLIRPASIPIYQAGMFVPCRQLCIWHHNMAISCMWHHNMATSCIWHQNMATSCMWHHNIAIHNTNHVSNVTVCTQGNPYVQSL